MGRSISLAGSRAAITVLLACLSWAAAPAHAGGRDAQADSLYRRALDLLSRPSVDARRAALTPFDEATRLAPDRGDIWLAYGNACLQVGRPGRARVCLERATHFRQDDDASWRALGRAWRDDWLASLEHSSLIEAEACTWRACAITPDRSESWNTEAALLLLLGRPRLAIAAAVRAGACDPEGAEPLLMLAAACFRSGMLAEADTAFAAARERVTPELRARLDGDLSRPGADEGAAGPPLSAVFASFDSDPDLTTVENEALLDYRTRVSLAWFLFRGEHDVRWDQRAELFARYGPPASIEFNPAQAQLGEGVELEFHFPRNADVAYAPDGMPYPYNLQVWHYPQLGLQVPLWDRSLAQHYELPYANDRSLDPRPDPARLQERPDLVALGDGRGVFRALPPNAEPMTFRDAVTRYPEAGGVRVLAHAFVAGSPADTLQASWALVGLDGAVVARESKPMAVSACEPGEERVAEFAAEVPAGDYRLDLAVQGTRGRRGLQTRRVHVDDAGDHLTMSDLVPLCGDRPAPGSREVRIEPQTRGRVSTRTLVVYYELERLAADPAGAARFEYHYSVHPRSGPAAQSAAAVVEATREEENVGAHRRQFVTVPIAGLPAGDYELRVEVRDLRSGERVARAIRFAR